MGGDGLVVAEVDGLGLVVGQREVLQTGQPGNIEQVGPDHVHTCTNNKSTSLKPILLSLS